MDRLMQTDTEKKINWSDRTCFTKAQNQMHSIEMTCLKNIVAFPCFKRVPSSGETDELRHTQRIKQFTIESINTLKPGKTILGWAAWPNHINVFHSLIPSNDSVIEERIACRNYLLCMHFQFHFSVCHFILSLFHTTVFAFSFILPDAQVGVKFPFRLTRFETIKIVCIGKDEYSWATTQWGQQTLSKTKLKSVVCVETINFSFLVVVCARFCDQLIGNRAKSDFPFVLRCTRIRFRSIRHEIRIRRSGSVDQQ